MTCQRCSNKAKEGTKHCPAHHRILQGYRLQYRRNKRLDEAWCPEAYDLSAWVRDMAKLAELLR